MGACFPVAGLQTELQAAHKESEYVRQKLRHLEEDLGSFRKKNSELSEEVQQKAGKFQVCPATNCFVFIYNTFSWFYFQKTTTKSKLNQTRKYIN